jgi:hypothetical protein
LNVLHGFVLHANNHTSKGYICQGDNHLG